MARRKSLAASSCPVARAVDIVGDRWALLIVRDAFDGVRRFGEFQENLGIARNILTDRLRLLVAADVFEVVPASDGSAYQEYVLTRKGEALFSVIVMLRQWGEAHLFARGEKHSQLIDRASGKPVPKLGVRRANGAVLTPAGTFVKKVPAPSPDSK
ncbi:helix-turn-helix transcriptional regulator [Trinickia sp. LjRoot230]|uniref:winged helix-turn-helix transcriptional regulator n=1 Tax=Trinickia sp. LjRoot230 TaxID=3342288 RepID=UPI003ECFF873